MECITDPSFIETYITKSAGIGEATIPPHPEIDPIDILLRFKPPHWRLKNFHEYMKCLKTYWLAGVTSNVPGYLFEAIFLQSDIFFSLDENLNREDIIYMLRDMHTI